MAMMKSQINDLTSHSLIRALLTLPILVLSVSASLARLYAIVTLDAFGKVYFPPKSGAPKCGSFFNKPAHLKIVSASDQTDSLNPKQAGSTWEPDRLGFAFSKPGRPSPAKESC